MSKRTEREDYHLTLNVYGPEKVETVRNALNTAKSHEACESHGEALAEISKAYTGWEATESRGDGE